MESGALALVAIAAIVAAAGWLAWLVVVLMRTMGRYAAATERHADALEAAVAELRAATRVERGARRALVTSVVDLALRRAQLWRQENLMNLVALGALPDQVTIVPDNASLALQYARHLSEPAAVVLTRAIDDLRRCEEQFGIVRRLLGKSEREFEKAGERWRQRLDAAGEDLRRAGELFQRAEDGAS